MGGLVVSDGVLVELAEECGEGLEELYLRGNRELTDAAVLAVATYCPNLTAISLSGTASCHYRHRVDDKP